MATAEMGPHPSGFEGMNLVERFKMAVLKLIAHKKYAEEMLDYKSKTASEAHREKEHHESREKRREEERQREELDENRAYHEAQSAELTRETIEAAQNRRAGEVRDNLRKHLNPDNTLPGSGYFIDELRRNAVVRDAVVWLIDHQSQAREVINEFVTRGREVHGDARQLIRLAQNLTEAAEIEGKRAEVSPLLDKIGERAETLLWEEFQLKQRLAREQRGVQGPKNYLDLLRDESGGIIRGIVVEKDTEKAELEFIEGDERRGADIGASRERHWKTAIKRMVTLPREKIAPEEVPTYLTDARVTPAGNVMSQIVAPVDQIWAELEGIERAKGGELSVDDLSDYDRKIRETEARIYPKDLQPGSDEYIKAVQDIRKYTEEKLDALAKRLQERLREETPPMKAGINSEEEFLREIVLHKGRLGGLFAQNPAMHELFRQLTPEGGRFRQKIFLKIHSSVILDARNSSHDNFGLYERADFTTFVDMVRDELSGLKMPATGESLGRTWADYFNNLSNAIRQSRDLDFWASQPAASIGNFNKSLGLFQNEYTYHMMGIPAVEAAFRAYEATLRSIMTSCDGYISPGVVEYDARWGGSFWDLKSKAMLQQMISMGAVPDLERDRITYWHQTEKDGRTLKTAGSLEMDFPKDEDEIAMYMLLAKGVGMASARYLEIFAQSKVPGANVQGFHSIPYEGLAKALNYWNVFMNKWKIGAYKYFQMINMLIPDEKKLKFSNSPQNDIYLAIKAYEAYVDGSFEEKYGSEAKRFADLTNFSGISSAIGKDTLWRQYDSSMDWSDREREYLGGATRLALSRRWAGEMAKDFLVIGKYRELYRKSIIAQNAGRPATERLPESGSGFDKLWREYGEVHYKREIDKEWEQLSGLDPRKGRQHTPLAEEAHHLTGAFETALKARVWVEMAMRNPLLAAHSLKVGMPLVGVVEGGKVTTKKIKLHSLLVQKVLGIPPEDAKYVEEYGRAGYATKPDERQQRYMAAILTLEGDLAAVRERAIREGRDLTNRDFDEVIRDSARRDQAKEYWQMVRQVLLGTDDVARAGQLYQQFGLAYSDNGQNYVWDHHKIHVLASKKASADDKHHGCISLKELAESYKDPVLRLTGQDGRPIEIGFKLLEAVESQPEWIYGTDDMAFGKMDWLNLGSRQWIRRGGDIEAHEMGGNAAMDFIVHGMKPTPDKHKMAEYLEKVRDAYSGDMVEAGWAVASSLAYMTDRVYAWDWKNLSSIAQSQIYGTRRNVAAWLANERREWWDVLEHADILPPNAHFYAYNIGGSGELDTVDIHQLRKICHADNADVWKEIIALGVLLALAITVYRAFTAPSEEEEGGGGGGGHH